MGTTNSNLYAIFAGHFPGDPAAVLLTTDGGQAYSYGDAERSSARVANCLVGMGLKPGDRVTVQVEKSPEMLFLYLGVLRAGLVFHPLNTAYTPEELEYFLGDAEPSAVVVAATDSGAPTTGGSCEGEAASCPKGVPAPVKVAPKRKKPRPLSRLVKWWSLSISMQRPAKLNPRCS